MVDGVEPAQGCGGGRFRVISEPMLEYSSLVRARVYQRGSSLSLADCPYRPHQLKKTNQMIIPCFCCFCCVVMPHSHQEGQTQSSKSGVKAQYVKSNWLHLWKSELCVVGTRCVSHQWYNMEILSTDMHWHDSWLLSSHQDEWLIKVSLKIILFQMFDLASLRIWTRL